MAGNAVTAVDYWVELRPYLVWAWILVTPLSLGVLAAGFIVARLPIWYLWPFPAAAAFIGGTTVFVSARQAKSLVAFLRRELEPAS